MIAHLALSLLFAQLPAAADNVLRVSLAGPPDVRHVSLSGSLVYWGNDVAFTQEVLVVDSMKVPAAGRMVTVSARTRDGVVARVLRQGVTDASGRATVRALFELASSDMRVTLQACVVETDACSPLETIDLREKLNLELTFSMALVGQVGDERLTVGRSSAVASFVDYADRYAVDGRLSYSLFSRGDDLRRVSLSTYVGMGASHVRGERLVSVTHDSGRFGFNYTREVALNPGAPAVGISGIFSRVAVDASISRATDDSPGHRQFTVLGFQPLSNRFALLGGFTRSQPTSVGQSTIGGRSRAPIAGLAMQTANRRNRFSGSLAWVDTAATTFRAPPQPAVTSLASASMLVNGSYQYYSGGPWGFSWVFSLGGLRSDRTTFHNGLYVTLRNPLPGL